MSPKEEISRLISAFDQLSQIFISMESFSGDTSLSKPEILALESISRQKALTMSDMARSLGVAFSTATKITDRLIERKLVLRERNHGDRRIVKVVLTGKGEEIVLAYQRQKKEIFERMMKTLSAEERENFVLILEKISNIAKEVKNHD